MPDIGVSAWPGVVARRRAYSNSDANTEAIIFFFFEASRESRGYAGENRKRRHSRRSHGRGSQRANAGSKTDAQAHTEIKVFAIGGAQVADAGQSSAVCHAEQHAVPAKRNFPARAVITDRFRCGRERNAYSDAVTNTNSVTITNRIHIASFPTDEN